MPRPRKVSDADVFAAAHRLMHRVGPADFTLEEIAREAGVTAGALVQRFGSKRDLMVALSAEAVEATSSFLDELRRTHSSPLGALRTYADCMAGLAQSPDAFVRNLAYLQGDLSDPGLRLQLERQARLTRAGLESLIKAAVKAGELESDTKPKALAKLVEAVLSGSLMTWVFYRETTAGTWMRRDLDTLLRPYVARRGSARGPRTLHRRRKPGDI